MRVYASLIVDNTRTVSIKEKKINNMKAKMLTLFK